MYEDLLDHVQVHKYFMGLEEKRDVPIERSCRRTGTTPSICRWSRRSANATSSRSSPDGRKPTSTCGYRSIGRNCSRGLGISSLRNRPRWIWRTNSERGRAALRRGSGKAWRPWFRNALESGPPPARGGNRKPIRMRNACSDSFSCRSAARTPDGRRWIRRSSSPGANARGSTDCTSCAAGRRPKKGNWNPCAPSLRAVARRPG